MDWKKKYTDLTISIIDKCELIGMVVTFKPFSQIRDPEQTCRILHKLDARLTLMLD